MNIKQKQRRAGKHGKHAKTHTTGQNAKQTRTKPKITKQKKTYIYITKNNKQALKAN